MITASTASAPPVTSEKVWKVIKKRLAKEKKEQKAAVSVDDTVKVIGEMKGWGSQVGIYLTPDRAVPGADLKKLLAAVNDNPWLDLEYFGREVPKVVTDHFLKVAQDPIRSAQKPRELKAALVGRWV